MSQKKEKPTRSSPNNHKELLLELIRSIGSIIAAIIGSIGPIIVALIGCIVIIIPIIFKLEWIPLIKNSNIPTATLTTVGTNIVLSPSPIGIVTSMPSSIPTLTLIPTPTSWPLGNQTTTDPKPLCTITVDDSPEVDRKNAKRLQFTITGQGGYCSWIIPLNGYNASTKKQITFWIRGEDGEEQYEVGIKDRKTDSGKEPKVIKKASAVWTPVYISLDSFRDQDLSSLDNFSLSFTIGSGTIYVDQLIFMP